nr:non-ribosomal peptide synthetase 1 [Streptomyces sp.]
MTHTTPSSSPTPRPPAALTPAQEQVWLLSRLVADSPLPHVPLRLCLRGHLDPGALQSALDLTVARHASLGARFGCVDHRPVQTPGAVGAVPVVHHDIRADAPTPDERRARVDTLTTEAVRVPFDLEHGPLLRACLIREDEHEHTLVVVAHRLVADRGSVELLMSQAMAAYRATVLGEAYVSARARAETVKPPAAEPAGAPPARPPVVPPLFLELPRARAAPADRRLAAGSVVFDVSEADTTALRGLGESVGTGLPAVLLAIHLVLLRRYTGQSTLAVSLTSPGRDTPDGEAATGCFERERTVHCPVDDRQTFRELVHAAQLSLRAATGSADLEPAAHDPAVLGLPGFSYRTTPPFPDAAGLSVSVVPEHNGATSCDLALHMTDHGGRLLGQLVFATDVFDRDTAHRAVGHLTTLLDGVVRDPDRPPAALPLLTEREERAIAGLNSTVAKPPDRTFHELFEEQAARTPDAVAVRAGDSSLTYRALNARANQLAHLLRELGAGPERTTGICMERVPQMVVAVLGVLKAGGAYVPVDPRDPAERTEGILRDAGAATVLVTEAASLPEATAVRTVVLDPEWTVLEGRPSENTPAGPDALEHAAYLLYTSGSTGRPKGVVVENRQLVGYTRAVIDRFGFDGPMRCAMLQPLTVDSSVTMLTPPLCTGGEVQLISRECALDAGRLADWARRWEFDVLKIAPSHLRALQSSSRFAELLPRRLLIIGGEASEWRWLRDLQRMAPHCEVFNHYGPTETTVGVLTLAVADHLDADWETAPIGVPLPGTRAHVVDASGQETPVGVPGELLIGGTNVTRGYHRSPALTAAAFVPDPFGGPPGSRLYRTGDVVRRLPDGSIAFLGRRDDQIKVRGFRVSLGEIDAALGRHPGVRRVVTIVREDVPGDRRIVAYIEPTAPGAVSAPALEEHGRTQLPGHMVPRALVFLDALPLSTHGKVDRAALPAPAAGGRGDASTTPADEPERAVTEIWKDLLHVESVGVEQNFFDLGGHSLMLVELHRRLCLSTGRDIDLLDLFQYTTVRAQAGLLAGERQEPVAPADTDRPRNPVQQNALLKRRQQQLRSRRGAS